MQFLTRWLESVLHWFPARPLHFPKTGFEVIGDHFLLEEENLDHFEPGTYYPVNIGDVYHGKYQIVGKLGFGATSTVWLAHDLQKREHVTLKIFIRGDRDWDELSIYHTLSLGDQTHPGSRHIRTILNAFNLEAPGGAVHKCLVQKPMWDSFRDMLYRNPSGRFTEGLLKAALVQLFLALDYLHSECHLIHTDVKPDNILQELVDPTLLTGFVQSEMESPAPRKVVDGAPIYASRCFGIPDEFGDVVLSDFGSTESGDVKQDFDAQPDVYRCPEVMLGTEWSYPIDIWNVGVMIWDLFEGRSLFHEDGEWKAGIEIPHDEALEDTITSLEGEKKKAFLTFIRGMLQWRPEDRKTAAQLAQDPWLYS
ncbi:related to dis1-suppressing protein kinase dsk1 [Cephalotrichum gorgonifer]|uniref:Related to dis1-suppressing protein kinase dsk1 n=1 Tax=Cephalotrichum gorgonifer TaxID=2041049 RepID=A0AAE8MY66_9PEZI|nr:related to dis1-suppressing protein kinase dsk1 [Cephalotrichum gorgonifer]